MDLQELVEGAKNLTEKHICRTINYRITKYGGSLTRNLSKNNQ
jgi:hypothetical protein